jgi:hypothetical protein
MVYEWHFASLDFYIAMFILPNKMSKIIQTFVVTIIVITTTVQRKFKDHSIYVFQIDLSSIWNNIFSELKNAVLF